MNIDNLWNQDERKALLKLVKDSPHFVTGVTLDFFLGLSGECDFEDLLRERAGLSKRYEED